MEQFNFSENIDRHNTSSVKWDSMMRDFGRNDLLPMWVADMDFRCAEPILEALRQRVDHGVMGYSFRCDSCLESFIAWMKHRHGYELRPEWVTISPGIVTALAIAVRVFTNPGDSVLTLTPVYPPFLSVPKDNGRVSLTADLVLTVTPEGTLHYEIDWEDLEKKMAKSKLMILSNPHNPGGRVWTREELTRIGEMAVRYNTYIFSDEIHCDLNIFGNEHIVFSSISKEVALRTIVAQAPSKTFNIAGMLTSVVFSESKEILDAFNKEVFSLHLDLGNVCGHVAMEAAYRKGEPWLTACLAYIEENILFVKDWMEKNMPEVRIMMPESSFLMWLDFSRMPYTHEEMFARLVNKGKVALNSGLDFGAAGRGFFRLNVGTCRSRLEEGLNRIKSAME